MANEQTETLRDSMIDAVVEDISQRLRAEDADPDDDAVFERIQNELFQKFPKMSDQEVENTAISVIALMCLRSDDRYEETSVEGEIGRQAQFRLIPFEEAENPENVCV